MAAGETEGNTHDQHAALPHDAHDAVVRAWTACSGVDKDADVFIDVRVRSLQLVDHAVDVDVPEALLQRIEGEAAELGCDEIRTILCVAHVRSD